MLESRPTNLFAWNTLVFRITDFNDEKHFLRKNVRSCSSLLKVIFSIFITFNSYQLSAQFFTEDFDDQTHIPAHIYTAGPCSDGEADYFGIVCLDGGSCGSTIASSVELTGGDGGSFLGAQDTNGAPCTSGNVSFKIDDINIAGQSEMVLCFEIAEDDDNSNEDWDETSNVFFKVEFDNSGILYNLLAIESKSGTAINFAPALDLDGDGVGEGTEITSTFQTFCVRIPRTGSLMDLQIDINSLNDGDEDIAIDKIQLFSEESSGTPPVAISSLPGCPNPGDLVITEIMKDPVAVLDANGEWFEVYNTTSSPIDMNGMFIVGDGLQLHQISGSVLVPAFDYVVFGINDDPMSNGGVMVDYEYSNFELANTSDPIILRCGITTIDRVDYDDGVAFPDPSGKSMSLYNHLLNGTDNDSGSSWCTSTSPFGDGDSGTPGLTNVCICIEPPEITLMTSETVICGLQAVTIEYSVSNGPTDVLSHSGSGSLSTSSLSDGMGSFYYTPSMEDLDKEITITAGINDPDGTEPCLAASQEIKIFFSGVIDPPSNPVHGSYCVDGGIPALVVDDPGNDYKIRWWNQVNGGELVANALLGGANKHIIILSEISIPPVPSPGQQVVVYAEKVMNGGFCPSARIPVVLERKPVVPLPLVNDVLVCEGNSTEIAPLSDGPIVFFKENFEGPFFNYTTSVAEFSNGDADFFIRTNGNNISNDYEVSNVEGEYFFAAQDLDGLGGGDEAVIYLNAIPITNISELNFELLLAEDDDDANQDWDDTNFDNNFVHVDYQIDGGGFQNLLHIEGDMEGVVNGRPRVDTNFDGVGDGLEITNIFQNLSIPILSSGNSLDIRITINLEDGDEDIAIDDIRISGIRQCDFYFYDADPNLGGNLIAGPAGSFDPMLEVDDPPIEIWVSCLVDGCESQAVPVKVDVQGGRALTCNDGLNISLGPDCSFDLDIDDLLEGEPLSLYTIQFFDERGIDLGSIPGPEHLEEFLKYQITNPCDGNSCWGFVRFEDQIPLTVDECPCESGLILPGDLKCSFTCIDEITLAEPGFTERCIPADVFFTDEKINEVECEYTEYKRTWKYLRKFHDLSEEIVELCTQSYYIVPLDPADIQFPAQNIQIECDGSDTEHLVPNILSHFNLFTDTDFDGKDDTNEGIPYSLPHFIDGNGDQVILDKENGLCNLLVNYSDQSFEMGCPVVRKVIRNWSVWDWCSGLSVPYVQNIEIIDNNKPQIKHLPADFIIQIEPWECTAKLVIPGSFDEIVEQDVCKNLKIEVILEGEPAIYSLGDTISGLELGSYQLEYTILDECHRKASGIVLFEVVDENAPVPVCQDELVVALGTGQFGDRTKLPAHVFDLGSHDSNCNPVYFKVIRMDALNNTANGYWNTKGIDGKPDFTQAPQQYFYPPLPCSGEDGDDFPDVLTIDEDNNVEFFPSFTQIFFDDYVNLCCADSGSEVWVILRVFDVFPGDGPIDPRRMEHLDYGGIPGFDKVSNDLYGRYSDCMIKIRIESKSVPEIFCNYPADLFCDDDLDDAVIIAHFEKFPPTVESNNICDPAGDPEFVGYTIELDDQCGYGYVSGEWGYDSNDDGYFDLTCETGFYIIPRRPFDPRSIKWPPHYTGEIYNGINVECVDDEWIETRGVAVGMKGHLDCVASEANCAPEWTEPDCGLVGWSLRADTIYFEQEVCVKIIKRWTVIDWCRWSPDDDHNDGLLNDRDDENDSSCEQFVAVEDWTLAELPGDGVPGFDPQQACTDYSCYYDEQNPVYFRYSDFYVSEHGELPFGSFRNLFEPILGENAFITLDGLQLIRNGINGLLNHLCLLANQPIAVHIVILDKDDKEVEVLSVELGDALGVYQFFTETVPDAIPEGGRASFYDLQIWSVDVDGYYTYDQVIKIVDETGPQISDEKLEACAYEDCVASTLIRKTAEDSGCANTLNWEVLVEDESGAIIYEQIFIGTSEIEFELEDLEVGSYRIAYIVGDGCNNEAIGVDELEVKDCKAPTPYCSLILSTVLMQTNGTVDIWAVDFDNGSIDNCEGALSYGLRISGTGTDSTAVGLTLSCEDLATYNSPMILEMWVFDEAGNGDWCKVFLTVSDHFGACDEGGGGEGNEGGGEGGEELLANIAGHVYTTEGVMLRGVSVKMADMAGHAPQLEMQTASDGEYAFSENVMYRDYQIRASRDGDDMNGVSTLDLVVMQKHILSAPSFEDPYRVIASDINNDGRVSAVDLLQLRRLILGIDGELQSNSSWRFVDASQELDVLNPFPFREDKLISELERDMMEEDFIGVKIGDVTGNANVSFENSLEIRQVPGNWELITNDIYVEKGQELVVVIKNGKSRTHLLGFQTTLEHKGLKLESIDQKLINVEDSHLGHHGDLSTLSWHDQTGKGIILENSSELFTLRFSGLESGRLSEMLQVKSNITNTEAYIGTELKVSGIELSFGDVQKGFELFQNVPNPFSSETMIGFRLPESNVIQLSIFDVSGKLIKEIKGEFGKGFHEINLIKEELGPRGLMYYRLQVGSFTGIRKMLLLD